MENEELRAEPLEEMEAKLLLNFLTLGSQSWRSAEQVEHELCPKCPFNSPKCKFMLKFWHSLGEDTHLICRGMRKQAVDSN